MTHCPTCGKDIASSFGWALTQRDPTQETFTFLCPYCRALFEVDAATERVANVPKKQAKRREPEANHPAATA